MSWRDLATRGLWLSGLATVARRILTAGRSFVLTFHGVAARREEVLPIHLQPSFDAAELLTALRWIGRRFRFLTPQQLLDGEQHGVLLTFDDGFANNYRNALPILEELETPAVFFVSARHVRDPRDWLPATLDTVHRHWPRQDQVPEPIARDFYDGMTREQLATCAEHTLLTIGSHTVHHPFLTRCDDATLAAELERSKSLLEEWTGRRVELFAYPAGDYGLREARAVRAAGYRAAFAEDSKDVGLAAYEIPRIGLYDYRAPYLAAKLCGLYRRALPAHRIVPTPADDDPGREARIIHRRTE